MERQIVTTAHGEISFHGKLREPSLQERRAVAHFLQLRGHAAVRVLAAQLRIECTSKMANQDDALQLVHANEEIELFACGLREVAAFAAGKQPSGAAGDSPAVVTRDEQAAVA